MRRSERVVFFSYPLIGETSLIKYIFNDLELPYYAHFIIDYANKDYYKGIGVQNKYMDYIEMIEWIEFQKQLLRFLKAKNIEMYEDEKRFDVEFVKPMNKLSFL